MTDPNPEPEGPEGTEEPQESAVMAQLRKDAEEGKKAMKELAALQRERAFDKAGIPEDGAGKWFRAGYDGEFDVDQIRAAAVADGIVADNGGPSTEEAQQAAASADRISAAATDGGTPEATVEALLGEARSLDEIEQLANDAGIGVPVR